MGFGHTILNRLGIYTKSQVTGLAVSASTMIEKAKLGNVEGMRALEGGWVNTHPEKWVVRKPTSTFKVLKTLRDTVPLISVCINSIKREIAQAPYVIKIEDEKERGDDIITAKLKELFLYVNESQDNFRVFISRLIDDLLTFDAGCFEKVRTIGGELIELYNICTLFVN